MRHYWKPLGVGVCIGILLAVFEIVFRIDKAVFRHACWLIAGAALLIAMLYNVLYVRRYAKRMRTAIAHYEAGEFSVYMDEVEDMLRTAKGRNLRNTLKIDLSVGHYALGEHESAIRILEDMSEECLRGSLRMVYRLNLCQYYFDTSRNSEAMEQYRAGEKEFARYRKSNHYGGSIALMDMFVAMEEGRYADAADLLAHARQTWKHPRLQKEYDKVEEALAKKMG